MKDETSQNDDADLVFDEEESSSDSIKKLRSKLKASEEENKGLLLGWQRARADFANLQKESSETYKKAREAALNDFLEDFIPVMDSFDMAFINKEAWEKVDENWRKGVEYIHSQAVLALEKNGIEIFGAVGDVFDPKSYHSSGVIDTEEESDDGKVIQVIQRGYKMGDTILRPASVKVANYKR